MGMIADLDGPQFVAERRGPRVPDIALWPQSSAVRRDISVAPSAKKRPSSVGATYSGDAAPDGVESKSTTAYYKDSAPDGAAEAIARDTPLVPRAAAEAVWEEACGLLGEALPRDWIDLLTERAETIYQRRGNYHRRLRGADDTGRDWLWAFMRHWLAALVLQHRPGWYRRLPIRYAAGAPPA